VPLSVSVTDCAAAVVPTTVLPKARLEGVSETPGAVPTPLRAMVCVPPLALSLMVITPVCVPLVIGVKVAAMTQVPPADTAAEVEHVVLGSKAKLPLIVRAVISSGLLPVFVRVTVCAAAVVPATVLPKVRVDGLSDTPANVPVPARLTLLVPTFDVMARVPVRLLAAVGVNVTPTSQLEPADNGFEVEQVVVPASTAKSPLMLKDVKPTAEVPALVTVTLSAPLVVPTV
jgi:hypothetical protein